MVSPVLYIYMIEKGLTTSLDLLQHTLTREVTEEQELTRKSCLNFMSEGTCLRPSLGGPHPWML